MSVRVVVLLAARNDDIAVRSQTRLRYIADRVLQSAYDMYQKPKEESWHLSIFTTMRLFFDSFPRQKGIKKGLSEEMMDELSALGLRHVGSGKLNHGCEGLKDKKNNRNLYEFV